MGKAVSKAVGNATKGVTRTIGGVTRTFAAPVIGAAKGQSLNTIGKSMGQGLSDTARGLGDASASMGTMGYSPVGVMPLAGATQIGRVAGDIVRGEQKMGQMKDEKRKAEDEYNRSQGVLTGIQKDAQGLASKYRGDLDKTKEGLLNQEAKSQKRLLAEKMKQAESEYNRRGLLGSGIAQKKYADQIAQSRSAIATRSNEISDELSGVADQMDYDATNMGLEMAGLQGQNYEDYYRNKVAQMSQQNSLYSAAGGALGNVGGKVASKYYGKT